MFKPKNKKQKNREKREKYQENLKKAEDEEKKKFQDVFKLKSMRSSNPFSLDLISLILKPLANRMILKCYWKNAPVVVTYRNIIKHFHSGFQRKLQNCNVVRSLENIYVSISFY